MDFRQYWDKTKAQRSVLYIEWVLIGFVQPPGCNQVPFITKDQIKKNNYCLLVCEIFRKKNLICLDWIEKTGDFSKLATNDLTYMFNYHRTSFVRLILFIVIMLFNCSPSMYLCVYLLSVLKLCQFNRW